MSIQKSLERFDRIDGANYGPCIRQEIITHSMLEWRTNKDGVLCIIQYYANGSGYIIYKSEDNV